MRVHVDSIEQIEMTSDAGVVRVTRGGDVYGAGAEKQAVKVGGDQDLENIILLRPCLTVMVCQIHKAPGLLCNSEFLCKTE